MLRFSGAGVSDVGRVRPHNEDSGFLGSYVALVADGVGGAAAGEIASATAAYSASAVALGSWGRTLEGVLSAAYIAAGDGVRLGVQRDLERLGMATTLTMAVTDGRRVVIGHVGDSRCYLLRDSTLRQVTTDHTYVQHLIDTGRLSAQARSTHPWRNVVLRSVDGDPEGGGFDLVCLDCGPGDRLLLCSDGLSDFVDEAAISDVLLAEEADCAAASLTTMALEAGGRDNITCLVLDLVEGPRLLGDGRLFGSVSNPANVVDLAQVRLPVPLPRVNSA